jgi:hypothetical protein
MKLAEALILRADCQKRVEHLKQRLIKSAKVQEGDRAPENPQSLIEEMERTLSLLSDLIKRINRTNSGTEFEAGKTLSDALAERDILLAKRAAYNGLAEAASVVQTVYLRSEIRFVSTIDVAEMQKQADELSRQYREMDSRIQEMNWKIELVE